MKKNTKQIGLTINTESSSQKPTITPSPGSKYAGYIILGLIVLFLGWCTNKISNTPKTGSVEWFKQNPSVLEKQVDNCTPVQGMRTADDIQFPEKCAAAMDAWKALGHKLP